VTSVAFGSAFVRAVHADDDTESASASLPNLRPNRDSQVIDLPQDKGVNALAWSDPAAGCHLALFAIPVRETSASEKILESLSATRAKSDYALTSSEGELTPPRLGLEGFGVTGIVSLLIAEQPTRSASLLACYWNEREPSYCRSICETADDTLRALTPSEAGEKQP
jgi:hypothetical protein